MELWSLPKARPISCSVCPAFQRRHTSHFCSAESPNRFPGLINTTFERSFIQMVLHRPFEPARLTGKFALSTFIYLAKEVESLRHLLSSNSSIVFTRHTRMDALTEILQSVRLEGAVFFNAEFTAPWGFRSPPSNEVATFLRRGARHVIIYHLLLAGRARSQVEKSARYLDLVPGD